MISSRLPSGGSQPLGHSCAQPASTANTTTITRPTASLSHGPSSPRSRQAVWWGKACVQAATLGCACIFTRRLGWSSTSALAVSRTVRPVRAQSGVAWVWLLMRAARRGGVAGSSCGMTARTSSSVAGPGCDNGIGTRRPQSMACETSQANGARDNSL